MSDPRGGEEVLRTTALLSACSICAVLEALSSCLRERGRRAWRGNWRVTPGEEQGEQRESKGKGSEGR